MRPTCIAIWPRRSSPGWSGWASRSLSTPTRAAGFGPILTAERIEDPALPTVLTYGHGDTVRGLDDQWRARPRPLDADRARGDRWYGRGTADNKGQHALNLSALEAVLAERGGKLGFNLKLVLETSEERGSTGLREFVAAHADALARRRADRQRRTARHARGADHRHRHARHLSFRPCGRPAARRRAFRPLGRADHRPRDRAGARARRDRRPARQILVRDWLPRERRAGRRARGVLAGLPGRRRRARRPRSIRTGASRA